MQVHTIVTHQKPHWDEVVAIWILRKFGWILFPGIQQAGIIYWPAGASTPDGRSAEEWLADGYLLVGVGGGQYDEHASAKRKRIEGQCAATLIARALGRENDPALKMILAYVLRTDTSATATPFDLASTLKAMHHRFWSTEGGPERIMAWGFTALDAWYLKQVEYVECAQDQVHVVQEVKLEHGTVRVVTVRSENEQMQVYARAELGGDVVVLQQPSTGNTQIFTSKSYAKRYARYARSEKKYILDSSHIALSLRIAEAVLEGDTSVLGLSTETLTSEGTLDYPGSRRWYYFAPGQGIFNGSLTNPNVEPTRMTLDRIAKIVAKNIRLIPAPVTRPS